MQIDIQVWSVAYNAGNLSAQNMSLHEITRSNYAFPTIRVFYLGIMSISACSVIAKSNSQLERMKVTEKIIRSRSELTLQDNYEHCLCSFGPP